MKSEARGCGAVKSEFIAAEAREVRLDVGSGHFAHLEVPAQVNAMIERYLALIAEPDARPRRSPRRDLVRTGSANQATDIRR